MLLLSAFKLAKILSPYSDVPHATIKFGFPLLPWALRRLTQFDVPVVGIQCHVLISLSPSDAWCRRVVQYHTLVWRSVPFVHRRQHPQPAHDEARVVRSAWYIDERTHWQRGAAVPTHQSGIRVWQLIKVYLVKASKRAKVCVRKLCNRHFSWALKAHTEGAAT